jgi:transposase
MQLLRPRQWGACWLGCELWHQLGLDTFWRDKLPAGRQGARWDQILQVLTLYRFIAPGSEWRLHRHWFDQSALADLLGGDFALVEIHRLYECHDKLLEHKQALFAHLTERWRTLFDAKYEVLLYDLTSTYFESPPPEDPEDIRRFGYSRDKRSDCVQVVIALIVTPEGFPMAYEVLSGNTADKTTLGDFLQKIQNQYGKAQRVWVMDRGIPTEEILEQMRQSAPPVSYLVGTPKGRLSQLEEPLLKESWRRARACVRVKLLAQEEETYVKARLALAKNAQRRGGACVNTSKRSRKSEAAKSLSNGINSTKPLGLRKRRRGGMRATSKCVSASMEKVKARQPH